MAVLQRAYERYRSQGLVIVGIGVRDSVGSLRQMTERLHVTFPTGYDEKGSLVAQPYRLYSIPTTVFVGIDGTIKAVVQGRVHTDTLQQYLPLILPATIRAR
jgi:peroxiredoxin